MTRRLLHSLLCLLLCGPFWAVSAEDTLPQLGDGAAALLTPEQEYRMGRAWLRSLRSQVPLLSDPLIQEYTEALTYKLASHSDLAEPDLAIVVVNSGAINAFAVPGGVIGLNAGLYLNASREEEVAAVISHEIAHVSQRHFARRYADAQRMNRAVLAAMLASIIVAATTGGEAGLAALATTQAAAIQNQLAYSRHHEREADRIGMQTLERAGMDPHAMPAFFEIMLRKQQYSGEYPEFLMTHPITEERIADSRSRANALATPKNRIDSLNYQLVRARTQALFFRTAEEAEAWFTSLYQAGTSIAQLASGYGLALSHIRARHYHKARTLIASLQQQQPDHMWFHLAEAELYYAEKRYADAIDKLHQVLAIMPGNPATSIFLADTYLQNNQPELAQDTLKPLLLTRRADPVIWKLAADAYGKAGDMARAHQAKGEFLFLNGDTEAAKVQLKYALEKSKDRFPLYTQIKNRATEMTRLSDENF